MRSRLVLVAALVVLLAVAATAAAQPSSAGSVRGFVKDEQGGVLPGVPVSAASPSVAGLYTAVTDGEGFYRLLDLPPGPTQSQPSSPASRSPSRQASSFVPASTSPSTW